MIQLQKKNKKIDRLLKRVHNDDIAVDSFQEWLPILKWEEDAIILKNHVKIKALRVYPINFKLKSPLEQKAILNSYKIFLKNLSSKIQIMILSKKVDISSHIRQIVENTKENSPIYEMSQDYIALIRRILQERGTITREFYVIFPASDNAENEMIKMKEYLASCGNIATKCTKEDFIELVKNLMNKRLYSLI